MMPFRLGLTGSIGMGKSTTAKMFADAGVPVWDADATVHKLYSKGGAAVEPMKKIAPDAVIEGAIDRNVLKTEIARDSTVLKRIENFVHPLVVADRREFMASADADMVLFDIPLLYETGAEVDCDAVVVVTAPENVQRERVLARGQMSEDTFEKILWRQLPDAEKRERADFVIDTSKGFDDARAQVLDVITKIRAEMNA
ncbi:dephospho-CoA kinase [Paracoccaceae bacterium GXU_MW_L88]